MRRALSLSQMVPLLDHTSLHPRIMVTLQHKEWRCLQQSLAEPTHQTLWNRLPRHHHKETPLLHSFKRSKGKMKMCGRPVVEKLNCRHSCIQRRWQQLQKAMQDFLATPPSNMVAQSCAGSMAPPCQALECTAHHSVCTGPIACASRGRGEELALCSTRRMDRAAAAFPGDMCQAACIGQPHRCLADLAGSGSTTTQALRCA
jgi:hypothetical protein